MGFWDEFELSKLLDELIFHPFDHWGDAQGLFGDPDVTGAPPGTDDVATRARTKKQLQLLGAATLALIAAPALYSASSKRKLKESDIRTGIALENASAQATGVLMTALAAPAISTGIAYILVQKLEDAGYVSRGLGNATQGLLTVAAAGPAIQGIGAIVGSAFRKAK